VSNGTTLLFGLPGVRVRRVETDGLGETVVHVETAQDQAPGCPECGTVSSSPKGRATTGPRDIPYGDREISVRWHKRRWRCREVACPRASFTESIAQVPPGRRTTGRLRAAVGCAVADANRCVSEVAAAHRLSWPTAHACVVELAEVRLGEPEPTEVLGIDETRRGKPRWACDPVTGDWTRTDAFDTGFVDLAGGQGLLGQVSGRTSRTVVDWLGERTETFRHAIRFVAIDPSASYAKAVAEALPDAVVVVDHFHLVALANATVTKVRRRVTFDQKGRRGRKVDPEWANRRRLLTARERLSDRRFAAMWNGLIDADPSNQILAAYIAKEQLRDLLALAGCGDRARIGRALFDYYHWCATTDIDELHTLATTIETWWPAIEAFLATGITNARTEGVNRLVKQVKRCACGFRNPENQRRRVRLHATRNYRAATA
jgi:transposase